MKMHIIGCSGTGKTYLADALAQKYNIPHYDLDDLQWDNSTSYGVRRDKAERAAMLAEILAKTEWIIEGVYYAWVEQCFCDADVIYLLDIPPRVYKPRIICRHIRRRLGIEKNSKKETLKSVINLLRWTDKFQRENMTEIRKRLKEYESKTVVIKTVREMEKVIWQEK